MTSSEASAPPPPPVPAEARERPKLRALLWYSIGGSLPPQHNTWVLHDVTGRTWWVRHFIRVFAIIAPLSAAWFYFLVPPFGAPAAYAGACLTGTLFLAGMIYILIDSDRRAVRAGYPSNYAATVRSRRAADSQHATNYERRERIAARRAQSRRYNKR